MMINHKRLWLKWTALVWLNALIGIWFSGSFNYQVPLFTLGVVLGICAFIPCYVMAELWAIKQDNLHLQKSLWISVIVRAVSQVVIIVDMMAGMVAIEMAEWIFPKVVLDFKFFEGFIFTIITGGLLSILVFVMTTVIMLILKSLSKSPN